MTKWQETLDPASQSQTPSSAITPSRKLKKFKTIEIDPHDEQLIDDIQTASLKNSFFGLISVVPEEPRKKFRRQDPVVHKYDTH